MMVGRREDRGMARLLLVLGRGRGCLLGLGSSLVAVVLGVTVLVVRVEGGS
jgi:hypothetical protein